jgi:hypothetical protein
MYIRTGRPEFDNMPEMVRGFLEKDILDLVIDGKKIRGYRSPDAKSVWIRDYSDMIRGFRYIENDLKSVIQHFADNQSANGRIFDYFTTFPEKLPCERENWTKYVRVPAEADVEYRLIKAAWIAWQATGDDDFIIRLLPVFEKALHYVMNSWYWDSEKFLVKRPYTIDTWDFAYTAGRHDWLQFQIDGDTFWGYMHGDNSGYYEAFSIMSRWYEYFGRKKKSAEWKTKASKIKKAMNHYCWNGSFYRHFTKITPVLINGLEEEAQLSLSNPININRGVCTLPMARSILMEYKSRKRESGAFAEWFSIHPPFPGGIFGDDKLTGGAYCNGGIMPLVGGELAKAAFDNGFEEYGVEILRQYYKLISEKGETYLWYFPNGTPSTSEESTSPEATPTDGWGSSAMLYALTEGLAGITDREKKFKSVRISPKWVAASVDEAEVMISYPASGSTAGYNYSLENNSVEIEIYGSPENIDLAIMLPLNKKVISSYFTGAELISINNKMKEERYFYCKIQKSAPAASVKLNLTAI